MPLQARLERETHTLEKMMAIFCDHYHQSDSNRLCSDCQTLLNYAYQRLYNCPFGRIKPLCTKCTIHCYAPLQRGQIKAVMRYSGPKMILKHPWLTLCHMVDGFVHKKK